MIIEIVARDPGIGVTGWELTELRVCDESKTRRLVFDSIKRSPSRTTAIQVARALVELGLRQDDAKRLGQRPKLEPKDSTYDVDLAAALYRCVEDSDRRDPNGTWWRKLFPQEKPPRWGQLLHLESGHRVQLFPNHTIRVVDEGGRQLDPQAQRWIAEGSLAHLQQSQTKLLDAIKRARKTPVAFWAWLIAEAIGHLEPIVNAATESLRTGTQAYLESVDQALTWATDAIALCGLKPFDTEPYYVPFFNIETCRLFFLPTDPEQRTKVEATINDHNQHSPKVRGIAVETDARTKLEQQLLGIADALDRGFGFVVFHDRRTGRTEAVTHEMREGEFLHASIIGRTQLRSLLRLFEMLFKVSIDWRDETTWRDIQERLARVRKRLSDDVPGEFTSYGDGVVREQLRAMQSVLPARKRKRKPGRRK